MTLQNSIPRLHPVIHVFISSTFSDMKAERNALLSIGGGTALYMVLVQTGVLTRLFGP